MFVPYDDRGQGEPEEPDEPKQTGFVVPDFMEIGFQIIREAQVFPFCYGMVGFALWAGFYHAACRY